MVVGGYQLGKRVGAGRIARVYRAEGPAGPLAIKLLAPDAELDDPAAVARFRHEVGALGSIRHPNVVPLLDHGVDDELGPYLVMPLLEGRTLREVIADGPIEPAVCALALREIASGLAALHDVGLVHRDLKPENIVIEPDGRPVILDLGLAWTATQSRHTEEGAIAGSVPYMAPEQIDGADPTPATDLWALAVIAHEWITGQRPFARPRQSEEVAAILAGQFEPLVERDRRVSPELGAVIDRCLGRSDRPVDGRELHRSLSTLAPGDAAAALRDPRAASEAESQRQVAALLDQARGLLARGKPFHAADRVDRAAAHRPRDPAVLALAAQVGRAPTRSRRWPLPVIGGALAALAGGAIVLTVTLGGSDRRARPAPEARPLSADQLPETGPPDRDGLARLEVPRYRSLFEDDSVDGGAFAYTLQHTEAEATASTDPAAHATYARALMASTRRAEGIAFLERSLERFPDDPDLWLLRGQVAMRTGELDRADRALSRAIELDPDRAVALRDRGQLRRLRGRLRDGFVDLSRAHRLDPDDPETLIALVAIYVAADRGADARPLARRATQLAPTSALPWIALASVSPDDAALGELEIALRNDPQSGPAWRAMCLVAARVGDPRAADDCLKARVYYREDADIVLATASIYRRRGDLQRAQTELFAGTVSIPDVRLWVELTELDRALGYDYRLPKDLARACELGHQPSCAEAPAQAAGDAGAATSGAR